MRYLFLGVALTLLWAGIVSIRAVKRCTKEIKGVYVKSIRYWTAKGPDQFAPVFRYSVNGQEYEQQCGQCFSEKYILKNFNYAEEYTIYIDEKKPKTCLVLRKVRFIEYLMTVLGVIFLFFSIQMWNYW